MIQTNTDIILQAKAVCKSFGSNLALNQADLTIKKGEIVALMGPSGAGKSTLLHCLAGIFVPDSGEIWFDGKRIDTLNEAERSKLRRQTFGFMFQFGQLVPELTAEDNVALPLLFAGVHRTEAYTATKPWFERLGIAGLEKRRSGELSGGQAQRVALARALASKPKVLFADEPTGALDTLTGDKIMDLLANIVRTEGTTVVLVTHEPRVAACADREVVVRDGKINQLAGAIGATR